MLIVHHHHLLQWWVMNTRSWLTLFTCLFRSILFFAVPDNAVLLQNNTYNIRLAIFLDSCRWIWTICLYLYSFNLLQTLYICITFSPNIYILCLCVADNLLPSVILQKMIDTSTVIFLTTRFLIRERDKWIINRGFSWTRRWQLPSQLFL